MTFADVCVLPEMGLIAPDAELEYSIDNDIKYRSLDAFVDEMVALCASVLDIGTAAKCKLNLPSK